MTTLSIDPARVLLTIEIPGAPVAKGRPKLTTRGGQARAYTPAKTQRYEDLIRLRAGELMGDDPLLEGPLFVIVEAYVAIPKALSTKPRRALIEAGELRPTTRPDLDNYIKCLDSLNGIVWHDDAQIVYLVGHKFYSEKPRLVITVGCIGGEE